ncbi:4-hydroxy-2-oxoglutarate aldolase, mitochondrial, partial [Ascosphaera pollenicola]
MVQHPQSTRTVFLDQPPSCLEFCPTAPDYFVIGTYLLSEHRSEEDASVIQQSKTGSVQLWKLDTASHALSQIQQIPTPHAIFDLQFSPHDVTIFATATSAATVTLYGVSSSAQDAVNISSLKTFSVKDDHTIPALFLAWNPPLPDQKCSTDGFAVSFSDGSISIFHTKQTQTALRDVESEEDLEELQLPNDPNPIEVWYVAFDRTPSLSRPLDLYAGDDFGALRCHRLIPDENTHEGEGESTGTGSLFPAQIQQSTTDRGRFHTAGVTAILPLGELDSDGGPNCKILLTGSYDEYIRIYKHSPIPRERGVLA